MLHFFFVALLPLTLHATEKAVPFSHELLDQVLVQYVDTQGLVDYAALKKDRRLLDAYIDSLRQTSPASHPQRFASSQHELAYWINAYNASVLRGVIDAYPVASVMDIKLFDGFFNRQELVIGGQTLTLNDLENTIIRPQYQDPRIHFVVNCGALSCPELENRAFKADDLEQRLEAALQRFAHNPNHVFLQGNQLHLSKILDWYGDDFSNWFPSDRPNPATKPVQINYLLPYLKDETANRVRNIEKIKITFIEYDWALNAQKPKAD